jgi:hypothetical protein
LYLRPHARILVCLSPTKRCLDRCHVAAISNIYGCILSWRPSGPERRILSFQKLIRLPKVPTDSRNPARPALQAENAWPVRDRRTRLNRPGAVTRNLFRSIFRSVCSLASGSPFNRLIPCKVKGLAAFVPRRHFGEGLQDMIFRKVCKVHSASDCHRRKCREETSLLPPPIVNR